MAPHVMHTVAVTIVTVLTLSSCAQAFKDPHNVFCGNDECYDVLGLQRGADKAEIKKAYRTISLDVHPDKNPSPAAKERFTVRTTSARTWYVSPCCLDRCLSLRPIPSPFCNSTIVRQGRKRVRRCVATLPAMNAVRTCLRGSQDLVCSVKSVEIAAGANCLVLRAPSAQWCGEFRSVHNTAVLYRVKQCVR